MTLITSGQLNELYYFAVLVYIGKTINTEDYPFVLEQDEFGDVFISYWALPETQPTRTELLTLQYEDVLAFSQKPNIYEIAQSKIPLLSSSDITAVTGFTPYGIGPGILVYNTTDSVLQVLSDTNTWVDLTTSPGL